MSVSHTCDQNKVAVFTNKEAIVLNTSKFSVEPNLFKWWLNGMMSQGCTYLTQVIFQPEKHPTSFVEITLLHRRLIHESE